MGEQTNEAFPQTTARNEVQQVGRRDKGGNLSGVGLPKKRATSLFWFSVIILVVRKALFPHSYFRSGFFPSQVTGGESI